VNYKNYEAVLDELREYLNEVDSEFVKKCIRAVSKIAIRYERSIEKCMSILAWQIKETRHVADHAENVVNELLIVHVGVSVGRADCSEEVSLQVQL
jgi:vesicle coat complex subunit